MAGLLKRLIKKAVKKTAKKVVTKKPSAKPTTATKRAVVRAKAAKAAKTKVNTSRKVGQKATLNGKPVVWNGDSWKPSSLANSVASKTPTKATGKPTKPKYASAPPKKGDAPKGTRDSANGSKTVTARGRSAEKLREKARAARRSKSKVNTKLRTEVSTDNKIAVAPGVKTAPGAKKSGTKTTQLTKRQRDRRSLTNKRDIGAKATAAKTPKSTKKTASQAGGPVHKGRDVKNSTDITARQRDGKSNSYGSAPQPKGTNDRAFEKGRVKVSAEERANKALKNFNVEGRVVKSNEKFTAKNMPNMTAAERTKARRAAEKEIRGTAQGLRAQVQDKVKRQKEAARNNVMPGDVSNNNGRDWRNRLSQTSAQRHSEHMTRIRSGKSVRTNGELVQSPKGLGATPSSRRGVTKRERLNRAAAERAKSGTNGYSATRTGPSKTQQTTASTSNGLKTGTDKSNLRPKSTTIRNGKGELEAKIPPKPRQATRTKKDTSYQPKGADPSVNAISDSVTKTGNKSPTTGATLNQQGPKRKPARADMESRANTGGKPASGPQAKMDAERRKEQKAMKALRDRQTKPKPRTSRLRPAEQRRNAGMQSRMNASNAAKSESDAAFKRGASGQGSW